MKFPEKPPMEAPPAPRLPAHLIDGRRTCDKSAFGVCVPAASTIVNGANEAPRCRDCGRLMAE